MEWLTRYIKLVRQLVDHTACGYVVLNPLSCILDKTHLCSKHAMWVFQDLFYARRSSFFIPLHAGIGVMTFRMYAEWKALNEIAPEQLMLPITIEDLPLVRDNQVLIRFVPINGLLDYINFRQQTEIFNLKCKEIQTRFYHCIWCHRNWFSQSVRALIKPKQISALLYSDQQMLSAPCELNLTEKVHLLEYGQEMFAAKTTTQIYAKYTAFVKHIWEDAQLKAPHDPMSYYYDQLIKLQVEIINSK